MTFGKVLAVVLRGHGISLCTTCHLRDDQEKFHVHLLLGLALKVSLHRNEKRTLWDLISQQTARIWVLSQGEICSVYTVTATLLDTRIPLPCYKFSKS
jgi:hypothetical protein